MTRKELKQKALKTFKANYWLHVGMNFLYALIIGALSATMLGTLILGGPITVGMMEFYKRADKDDNPSVENIGYGFNNFGNAMVGFILSAIFIMLWSLLLIIPGIIKSYAYAMTFYLINKDSSLSGKEAIALSQKMMKGYKWKLFVLQLSFIGWILLDMLTFGLLGLFYITPYMQQSFYDFYDMVYEANTNASQEATVSE